jgi:hypothetical protein
MTAKLKSIHVEDEISFAWSAHVLNACFGKNYKGWMKAWYQLSDNEAVWFPKLAIIENGVVQPQDRVYGCINILSDDGCVITERHSTACGDTETTIRYVFAKPSQKEGYRYIGTFVRDLEQSGPDVAVYRRIGTSVDLTKWYVDD